MHFDGGINLRIRLFLAKSADNWSAALCGIFVAAGLLSAADNGFRHGQLVSWDPALWTDEMAERVPVLCGKYGIELTAFVIENVSLPEEVEKAMDRRTSMGVVGDLQQYTQYQAAEALRGVLAVN